MVESSDSAFSSWIWVNFLFHNPFHLMGYVLFLSLSMCDVSSRENSFRFSLFLVHVSPNNLLCIHSSSPVRIGKNNISCGIQPHLMVTGGPEGFHLLLNLLNIWRLQTVFIFSYLSASLYSILQLSLQLFHALFFFFVWKKADGLSWQVFPL